MTSTRVFEKLLELLLSDYEYAEMAKNLKLKAKTLKEYIPKLAEATVRFIRAAKAAELMAWRDAHSKSEADERQVFDFFVAYGSAYVCRRFQIKFSELL